MGNGCRNMTESDEYRAVCGRFLAAYDSGAAPEDITRTILTEYRQVFDPADGVLYEVYFALGRTQWMCGGVSADVLAHIREIADRGEYLAYCRAQGVSEAELQQLQGELAEFVAKLEVPRTKIRQRNPAAAAPRPVCPMHPQAGEVFACRTAAGVRVFAVVQRLELGASELLLSYVWRRTFTEVPGWPELLQEDIMPLGCFRAETFPGADRVTRVLRAPQLRVLGPILPREVHPGWVPACYEAVEASALLRACPAERCLPLAEALERAEACLRRMVQPADNS